MPLIGQFVIPVEGETMLAIPDINITLKEVLLAEISHP
ncbi:unnamed protein product, partial [marine sediment metagenome]